MHRRDMEDVISEIFSGSLVNLLSYHSSLFHPTLIHSGVIPPAQPAAGPGGISRILNSSEFMTYIFVAPAPGMRAATHSLAGPAGLIG